MVKSKKRLTSDAQWDKDGKRSDGKHASQSAWLYVAPPEPETPDMAGREAPGFSDKNLAVVVLWTNDRALWSISRIAKTLGISRNTVHKVLKSSALID
jgi:transcriptional regulator of acetoin/glycerol metabolism